MFKMIKDMQVLGMLEKKSLTVARSLARRQIIRVYSPPDPAQPWVDAASMGVRDSDR
jgi:hypothetical protein